MHDFADIATRPYGYEDILGKSLKGVFGRRFLDLFLPLLVPLAVQYALYYAAGLDSNLTLLGIDSHGGEGLDPGQLDRFWAAWSKSMTAGIVGALLYALAAVHVLLRVRQAVLGEQASVGWTFRQAAEPSRYMSFVVTCLAASVGIAAGALFCILPGLILMVFLALAPVGAAFADRGFELPLARSFRLVSGRFGLTCGVLLTLVGALVVLGMLVSLPLLGGMMGSGASLFDAPDFDAFFRDYMARLASPGMMAYQIASGLVSVLAQIVLGFAAVVMYLNYTLAPRPTAEQPAA
jgi:hypothetical protein